MIHVIIFNIMGVERRSLKVITGKQITDAQHIGQVIGDFVGTGNINFPTIVARLAI